MEPNRPQVITPGTTAAPAATGSTAPQAPQSSGVLESITTASVSQSMASSLADARNTLSDNSKYTLPDPQDAGGSKISKPTNAYANVAYTKMRKKILKWAIIVVVLLAGLAGTSVIIKGIQGTSADRAAARLSGVSVQQITPTQDIRAIPEATIKTRSGVSTLVVSGDVASQQLRLAPQELPDDATAGTIVFDSASSTLQYFNGTVFVPLAAAADVISPQETPGGVTSLQGLAGAVTLTAGGNINLSQSGNTITITAAGLNLPQDLAPTATPTFNGINLTAVGLQNGNTICDSSNNCGLGGSLFTDAGAYTYLTSTTDNLVVGANTPTDARMAVVAGNTTTPTEWVVQTAAEQNDWRSVTHSGTLFVAVAATGTNRVMTSTTGATWSPFAAAEANSWNSVVYGGGAYVAVANSGTNRVMRSTNGTSWSTQSAAEPNSWQSVTFGNSLFVAVATDGTNRVMTSSTGTSWASASAAEANSWQSVTYGNNTYVAVASDGTNRVMTSTNGTSWSPVSVPLNNWRSVTYGNGVFVAVASTGTNRIMTSPDGTTWTPRTAPEQNEWRSVTFGDGQFVAVAASGTSRVMTSADGTTWTAYAAAENNAWQSIVYGNEVFAAVANTGSNRVMTSGGGTGAGLVVTGNTQLSGAVSADGNLSVTGGISTNGDVQITSTLNSPTSFVVQNADSEQLFTVNSEDSLVYIGSLTPDATATLFIFDTKNTAGDPTGVDGGVYYNSASGKLRCYEASVWKNCIASGGVGSGDIAQGGNTFGTNLLVGTLDAFGVEVAVGGTVVMTFDTSGAVLFQNSTDSSAAFMVQNATGVSLFSIDSTLGRLYVGPAGGTTDGVTFVLGVRTTAGDPSGTNGSMYYNDVMGKFRCYEASVWKDCISTVGGGGDPIVTKTADQPISATTYADVADLGFSVASSGRYSLSCSLIINTTGNGGYLSMNGPASPTKFIATFDKVPDQGSGDQMATSQTYDDPATGIPFLIRTSTVGSNQWLMEYKATLTNGANSGDWVLRAKANSGGTINIYANSYCTLKSL